MYSGTDYGVDPLIAGRQLMPAVPASSGALWDRMTGAADDAVGMEGEEALDEFGLQRSP